MGLRNKMGAVTIYVTDRMASELDEFLDTCHHHEPNAVDMRSRWLRTLWWAGLKFWKMNGRPPARVLMKKATKDIP